MPHHSSPIFDLWVPRPGTRHDIAPRSAIVSSSDQSGDRRLVYYEGNLLDAENLRRYAQRVHCAAGRATQRYPTVAKALLSEADLMQVGRYDSRSRRITMLTDADALAAFLDPEPLPTVLSSEDARRRVARALGSLGVPQQDMHAAVWDRLHAWTGATKRGGRGIELECVTEDGTGTEWLPGIQFPAPHLASGLRHLLDAEATAWN